MEAKVVEIREHEFEGDDGKLVKGMFFYLTVPRKEGNLDTRRIFASDDRVAEWAYIPKVGDNVLVFVSNGKVIDMLKSR